MKKEVHHTDASPPRSVFNQSRNEAKSKICSDKPNISSGDAV